MLHFIEPPTAHTKNSKTQMIVFWKFVIRLPNVNPLEFKVSSIKQLSDILGIKETTLRKIVYKPDYHSKRYRELLKYITLTPQYNHS